MTLGDKLSQFRISSAALAVDLESMQEAIADQKGRLKRAMLDAERESLFAQFDRSALQDFLDHPYLLQKMEHDQYRLIVPRFYGFTGGWLDHHEGNYSVYIVSRFAHLLAPVPEWLASELGFADPDFQAQITENVLTVTQGDPALVFQKFGGSDKIARREGNKLFLKPASRFEILRRIIREGILPFVPRPVDKEDRRPAAINQVEGKPLFVLRPHQFKSFEDFVKLGAVLLVPKPQTGKTFVCLQALAEIKGPKIIIAPTTQLLRQWKERVAFYLAEKAAAEITYSTYLSAHKHLKQDWILAIMDEAHHAPADHAMEVAASIKAKYRIGPSATPFREDGQHDLMLLLCGFPIGTDWPIAEIQKPRVTVWLCDSESQKISRAVELARQPSQGKTLIYVQRIAIGDKLSHKLKIPFYHGKNQKDFADIKNHQMAVVSSIADMGLSLDVRRIIEVDFLFGSRMQAGQRLGRLMNTAEGQKQAGQHHIFMTHHEYKQYGKRLLAYEAWNLEIDIQAA